MDDFHSGAASMGEDMAGALHLNQQSEIRERAQAWGVSLELAEYLLQLEKRIRELEGKN